MPRSDNPDWTRDELILAVDLYLRHPTAGKTHPAVLELSDLLQVVGPKQDAKDPAKFRNANGVYMKLMNFRAVDPNRPSEGLPKGGKQESAIWEEFAVNSSALAAEVARIRSSVTGAMPERVTKFWALVANPRQYRIQDAIAARDTDWWTTGGHDIRGGDWAVIWKAKANEPDRGIVALAEVLGDPEEALHDVSEWRDDSGKLLAERVPIRYADAPGLPLWIDGPADTVVRDLSVSRATGGGVFKVTPEQWDRVLEAAGGAVTGEAVVEDAVRPRARKQGLISDVARKLAVEKHAVALATKHYEAAGWAVEDVGSWASYDLRCRRDSEELHVEVKGTTGAGLTVNLTANEVLHAETFPRSALFVVTDIAITEGPDPQASGGRSIILDPWLLNRDGLRARVYEYVIPAV